MNYVYVLLSLKDNEFYTGITKELTRRMNEHIRGKTSSTKGRRPIILIYYEAHLSEVDALRRERYFKSTKGRVTLRQILRDSLASLNK